MVAISHRDPKAPFGAPRDSTASGEIIWLHLPSHWCRRTNPCTLAATGDLGPMPLTGAALGPQLSAFSLLPQTSLNKLLETLGKAEPFFIRCIRSNAEKVRGFSASGR